MDNSYRVLVLKLIKTSSKKDDCDDNGNTHLHHLVKTGNHILVKDYILEILDNKNKFKILNKKNNDGDTPLHLAVKNNFQIIAHLLAQAGSNTELTNNDGKKIKYVASEDNESDSPTDHPSVYFTEVINMRGGGKKKVYRGKRKL